MRGHIKQSQAERLRAIAELEGLRTTSDAIEFLIREYNAFPPGYPGGYVALRQEYGRHLAAATSEPLAARKITFESICDCYPNAFIVGKGVREILQIRSEWGRYAARKLAPLDQEYRSVVDGLMGGIAVEALAEVPPQTPSSPM